MAVFISAFPPRGTTNVLLQTKHLTTELAWLNTTCSFPQSLHLTFKKRARSRGTFNMLHSPILMPFARKPRLVCILPQTLHFNTRLTFFVVFANFLCSDRGCPPYPAITRANWRWPQLMARGARLRSWRKLCTVCLRHEGQYVRSCFGTFIFPLLSDFSRI